MSSYSESQEKFTREKIDDVVKRLRKMADDIERYRDHEDVSYAVSSTVNLVLWGVANLKLDVMQDNLVRYHEAISYDKDELISELQEALDSKG